MYEQSDRGGVTCVTGGAEARLELERREGGREEGDEGADAEAAEHDRDALDDRLARPADTREGERVHHVEGTLHVGRGVTNWRER